MSNSPKQKGFCYKSECKVVKTGFQWNDWKVCSHCKEELTDTLANRIEEDTKRKESKKDDTDYYDIPYGYSDPFGD